MPECLTSLLDSSDANKVWSWLPCGVACKAGELVELQSSLAGSMWGTASTNLAATSCGGGLVRSGSQYVLNDLFGRVAQARDSSGTLVASATYDVFGVQRTGSGAFAAGIIRKTYGGNNEDGIALFAVSRAVGGWGQALECALCLYTCRQIPMSDSACAAICASKCNPAPPGPPPNLCPGGTCVFKCPGEKNIGLRLQVQK